MSLSHCLLGLSLFPFNLQSKIIFPNPSFLFKWPKYFSFCLLTNFSSHCSSTWSSSLIDLLGLSYVIRKDLLWSKSQTRNEFILSDEVYPQTSCPPRKTVSDSRSSIEWSMSSVRAHLKRSAQLGQIFRWGVPSDELTPHVKLSVTADQVLSDLSSVRAHSKWLLELGPAFRWGVPSDELTSLVLTSCGQDQN